MKKRIACLLLTLVMLVSLIPTAAITASADGLAISEAGIKVIKNYMGFKKSAYQVADGVYKIGYGTPSVQGATRISICVRNWRSWMQWLTPMSL